MHSLYLNLSDSDSTLFIIDKTNTGLKDLNCGILKFMQLSCHFAQERTILKTSFMELPCHFAQKRTFFKTKNMELFCHFAQTRTFFRTKYMECFCHFAQKRTVFKKINGTSLPLCTEKNTSQKSRCNFSAILHRKSICLLYFDMIHQSEFTNILVKHFWK